MKFGHELDQTLKKEGFPPEWVSSAINYKQLKKCIKRVERELLGLGLDRKTVELLWQSLDNPGSTSRSSQLHPIFQYSFADKSQLFRPKLIFLVDPDNATLLDATLSPETWSYLQKLAVAKREESKVTELSDDEPSTPESLEEVMNPMENLKLTDTASTSSTSSIDELRQESDTSPEFLQPARIVEVPLMSNADFFELLMNKITTLDMLHEQEERHLEDVIKELGDEISKAVDLPKKKKVAKSNLYAWRTLFDLYVDSDIFFSTRACDRGQRTSVDASKRLQLFIDKANEQHMLDAFKFDGGIGVIRFIQLNEEVLKILKFQEINRTALTKILKKFDKHTALRASKSFPQTIASDPFMAQSVAKDICARISQEIIPTVPQVNDYQCPICMGIAWRPVRLRCSHSFCIRCLVVMQRENQDHCPLCRENVVMQADSDNIDRELVKFLKKNFPKEVKEKQKENEYLAGVDMYGPDFKEMTPCIVM
ncbi:MAG: hypothetical protein M1834_008823 [Cirrosporium novae-zelandiae]|nr:MAG: hypothetical protein M1834_008823 [Cirrosporium novae-zelandiae]